VRLLLDTHAFLWWLAGHPSLSKNALAEIGAVGNDVFVSAAPARGADDHHGENAQGERRDGDVDLKQRIGAIEVFGDRLTSVETYTHS
jgi:hypothetical protein